MNYIYLYSILDVRGALSTIRVRQRRGGDGFVYISRARVGLMRNDIAVVVFPTAGARRNVVVGCAVNKTATCKLVLGGSLIQTEDSKLSLNEKNMLIQKLSRSSIFGFLYFYNSDFRCRVVFLELEI